MSLPIITPLLSLGHLGPAMSVEKNAEDDMKKNNSDPIGWATLRMVLVQFEVGYL